MAFCSACGVELADGAAFCSVCGTAVGIIEEKKDNQRKVSFEGEVHKCPYCGEVLKGFESVCSACGVELRGMKTADSVQEFVKKLEAVDAEKGGSAWLAHQAFGEDQISPIVEKKVNLIKNFPIPNTKEDIREFMILASTNLDPILYESQSKTEKTALMGAWKVKLNQAYQKAKMSFGTSSDFRSVHKIYDEKILKPKRKKMTLIGLAIAIPVIVVGAILAFVLL